MVGVPVSRLEGPGFVPWYRQVGGSVLLQPCTVSKLRQFRSPYIACTFQPALAPTKGRPKTPACNALQSHGPQSPAAPKESMTKIGGSVQLGLLFWVSQESMGQKAPPKEGMYTKDSDLQRQNSTKR